MGLTIKVHHPLGEQLIVLEPCPVQTPAVVGRTSGVRIQVPSVAVQSKHAALFVHEGRWAVQDTSGTGATFVNRLPLQGPTFLKVGDVISLGASATAPTIEIDPDGPAEGRSGYVHVGGAARSSAAATPRRSAGVQPAAPVTPPAAAPAATPVARPMAMAVPVAQPVTQGWDGGSGTPDELAWSAAAQATPSTRRKKKQSSGGGMFAGVVVIILAVGACGAAIYLYTKKMNAPAPVAEAPKPATKPATKPVIKPKPSADAGRVTSKAMEISTSVGVGRDGGTVVKGAPATAGSSPAVAANEVLEAPDEDKLRQERHWRDVMTAYYSPRPLEVLLKLDAYENAKPDSLVAEVEKVREGALDRLWFKRIIELWKQKEAIATALEMLDEEIAAETREEYKQTTLVPRKQALVKKMEALVGVLEDEMGYTAPNPPTENEDVLKDLRAMRDPTYYAKWKAKVLSSVKKKGVLPLEWPNFEL